MQNEKSANQFPKAAFFAASNSGRGFISYFDKIFKRDNFERVYILKGGPGTGKSSLIKSVISASAALGYEYEAVLCSSDPTSFDGAIIKKPSGKIAIIDGTSPHTTDPEIPGAVDEIINLGDFWCEKALGDKRERIEKLISEKSRYYACAYAMLKSAESYASHKRRLISAYINEEKLTRAAERLVSRLSTKEKNKTDEYKLKHAISADGCVGTDVYAREDGFHYAVTGIHGAAFAFFDLLTEAAKRKGLSATLSPSPLSPDVLDAVGFEDSHAYFYFTEHPEASNHSKVINTERFLRQASLREIKPTLRLLSRLERDAVSSAVKMLEGAKKSHFELEDIYISAMDFEKKEKMQKELIERLI